MPLLNFAAEHDVVIRFIELMPVSLTEMLSEKNFSAHYRGAGDVAT
ncbi:MAG: hypothetical protein WDM76_02585 [Limisphaerales bacterium]